MAEARTDRALDAIALAVAVALSAIPYLGRLGFYSDDWALLAGFEATARAGHSVLASGLTDYGVRPMQGLYLALLFDAFGRSPLGYHLINTTIIAVAVVLLYLVLVELRAGRSWAFAAALIFALLPQLSTVRAWYAAFQIPLSLVFALLAILAQLLGWRSGRLGWAAAAVVATGLSLAAYEICAPLIAGFAAALLLLQIRAGLRDWRRTIAPAAVLAIFLCGIAFKLLSSRASGTADIHRYLAGAYQLIRPDYDWRVDSGLNLFAAANLYAWMIPRDWACALWGLLTGRSGAAVVGIAAPIAVLACWRLRKPHSNHEMPLLRLLLIGVAAFLLGHATFVIVPAILFTPSGIDNRVLVAAATGYAMILAALVALAARAAPARLRNGGFTIAIVVLALAEVARLETIDGYWAQAPDRQNQVLAAARTDLARLPAGSTVILDGVCPYYGPAVVFEAPWDTGPALGHALGREVSGDTVSPRMSLTPTGIATSIYKQPALYPYGPRLFAYNPRLHLLAPLTDAAAARRYFSTGRPPMRCPKGYVGHGVVV
jgi:hypothetical protein